MNLHTANGPLGGGGCQRAIMPKCNIMQCQNAHIVTTLPSLVVGAGSRVWAGGDFGLDVLENDLECAGLRFVTKCPAFLHSWGEAKEPCSMLPRFWETSINALHNHRRSECVAATHQLTLPSGVVVLWSLTLFSFSSCILYSPLAQVDHQFPERVVTFIQHDFGRINPDDILGKVQYEKGYAFLNYLETLLTPVIFQKFFQGHIKKYRDKNLQTRQFVDDFAQFVHENFEP